MDLNSKLAEKIKSADNAITDRLSARSAAPLNTHCLTLNSVFGRQAPEMYIKSDAATLLRDI